MFDNQVTRFSGVNNTAEQKGSTNSIFSDLYVNNRVGALHEYPQDFDQFIAADWVNTGAGSAALTAGDGGRLLITSPVSTFQSVQKTPAHFQMAAGFRCWGRFIANLDSLLGNTLMGLLNVTVTPFTGASQTDGIWFTTDVTTGQIKGNIAVASSIQTVDLGVQIVAGQFARLSWYYDGESYPNYAPNGRVVFEAAQIGGQGVTANARGVIQCAAAFPGATLLTTTMAVNASTAVARTLNVDLAYIAKDRVNINASPVF